MTGGLLVPTGNIECDLISFISNRQHSATSPIVPSSRGYSSSRGYLPKDGSLYPDKQTRPLTEHSARRNTYNGERRSRARSAHVLCIATRSEPNNEVKNKDDRERTSNRRAEVFFTVRRRSTAKCGAETSPRAKLGAGRDLIASQPLQRDISRAPLRGEELEIELSEDLQSKLELEHRKRAGSQDEGDRKRYPLQQKKFVASRKARKGVKKSKKHVKWKKSVLTLPTGSDFDNLVRSGIIAKHIAAKERTRQS